jgi:hypothetical protein
MNIHTINKFAASIGVLSLIAGGALAANNQLMLMAQTKKFDPGHSGEVLQAQWMGGMGMGGDHGLILAMNSTVAYPPGASADATIQGVEGHELNSLGFDHKIGTACTGGAPRYSVETPEGGSYAFGCSSGTHVDLGNGWERITFSDADVQHLGGPAWPGFASSPTISFLQVLQDEGGSTTLDNLAIGLDGEMFVITKPGAVKAQ